MARFGWCLVGGKHQDCWHTVGGDHPHYPEIRCSCECHTSEGESE